MSEFMRRHRLSVDRLHQSYHELSRSAQRLIQMFQSVYDDMARMQVKSHLKEIFYH